MGKKHPNFNQRRETRRRGTKLFGLQSIHVVERVDWIGCGKQNRKGERTPSAESTRGGDGRGKIS